MSSLAPDWIGVDMGGSGARLTRVSWVPGAQAWRAEGPLVTFLWEPSNREPTPLEDQLGENAQPIHPEEAAHGEKRLAQLACAIRSLEPTPATLLALAAPGLRDPDSGGLQAVRNGPRQPFLVRDLAARLDQNETYLFGDSLAGAAGELYGLGGALFGSTNGFYLAGGTGLAEALILGGEVCELTPPWEKALQVFENGVNLEDLLAPYRLKRTPSALDSNGELRIEVLLSRLESYVRRRQENFIDAYGTPIDHFAIGEGLARILAGTTLPEANWTQSLYLSTMHAAPAIGAVALASKLREHRWS